jgi:hypothetical protein
MTNEEASNFVKAQRKKEDKWWEKHNARIRKAKNDGTWVPPPRMSSEDSSSMAEHFLLGMGNEDGFGW